LLRLGGKTYGGSPLTFRMSPRALTGFHPKKNDLMKKTLEKQSGKYCKLDSKRVAKWVDKLSIMGIMPSMKGGNYRFR
jgi:SH3-like domain-containing protein